MQDDWKQNFRSNTTKMSFNLVLSRPMMEFLCACADDVHWDRRTFGSSISFPDNFLATEHALVRRGLVERKPYLKDASKLTVNQLEAERGKPPCRLTPAGAAVAELLKVGGLFLTAEEALQKMKARPGRW